MNIKKDLAEVRSFFIGKKEASDWVKKRIRYFIAAVQDLYRKYIITIMKKGRGCRHPEEFYVPVYLYPAMFKKVAEHNRILWDQEQFIKDMSYNRKREYYCSNQLLNKISLSLDNTERTGYKITEYYTEMKLEPETEIIVISACLFREGEFLIEEWNRRVKLLKLEALEDFFKENGLLIIYYLLFETDCNMKINKECREKYSEIWKSFALEREDQCKLEEVLIYHYFDLISNMFNENFDEKRDPDQLHRISWYKNSMITGIRSDVLEKKEVKEEANE